MRPFNAASVGFGKLVGSWVALTGSLLAACLSRPFRFTDRAAEVVKDALLDLGADTDEDSPAGDALPASLPLVRPDEFAAAMHPHIEAALLLAAEAINEDECGCWSAVTRERVLALFHGLAQEALAQALELRVAAAEASMAQTGASGLWVRKYRRMCAAEGRWPPEPSEDVAGPNEVAEGAATC
jgi:hypothetical protein